MGFLPTNYEQPSGGKYFKLSLGENRFRILADALIGNSFWTTSSDGSRTPNRRPLNQAIGEHELGETNGKKDRPKLFWAVAVWNYAAGSVQILEITQSTIQEAICNLVASRDWGDPVNAYDITVTKSGVGMETKYSVVPAAKGPTSSAILAEFKAMDLNLEALYDNDDPFAGGGDAKPRVPDLDAPVRDEVIVLSVAREASQSGTVYYVVHTNKGEFFTTNEGFANVATSAAAAASSVRITWSMSKKGSKTIDAIEPTAAAVANSDLLLDDDDIPF